MVTLGLATWSPVAQASLLWSYLQTPPLHSLPTSAQWASWVLQTARPVKASSAPQSALLRAPAHPSLAEAWHSANDHHFPFSSSRPKVQRFCPFAFSLLKTWLWHSNCIACIHHLSLCPSMLMELQCDTFWPSEQTGWSFYSPSVSHCLLFHIYISLRVNSPCSSLPFFFFCLLQTTFFSSYTRAAVLCPCILHLFSGVVCVRLSWFHLPMALWSKPLLVFVSGFCLAVSLWG